MKSRNSFMVVLGASLLFYGCQSKSGGTSTGNPMVSFTFTGSSQTASVAISRSLLQRAWNSFCPSAFALPAPTLSDSQGRTVTLSYFWATIGKVEFSTQETRTSEEVDGTEISFIGPFSIDMLASSPSSIGTARVTGLGIHRVKMKIEATSSAQPGAPQGLTGKSLYISGQISGIPFTFSSSDESEIEIAGPNAINPTEGSKVLLALKTTNLFKKIDMTAITSSTDISETNRVAFSNPCPLIVAGATDLYTCFRNGLTTESNLGIDDGDNELRPNDPTVK